MLPRSFPNEPEAYRTARDALREAEKALRQQIEDVAAQRRALPLGGEVPRDYVFTTAGPGGERSVALSELFGAHDSLFLYEYMFAPDAERPCPMCTSFLDSFDGAVPHLQQRVAVAVVARAPIQKLTAVAKERGWRNLPLLSSGRPSDENCFQSDYLGEGPDGGQWPMANVFRRVDGRIHHFWSSELLFEDFVGGDSRHVDALIPIWNVLDLTPEGRGTDFYPGLSYGGDQSTA